MARVSTRERILQAALKLFAEQGYQKTSIAQIETEAGLVPRAGALYRHFDSKRALLFEIAKSYISESPDDFALDKLSDFGDTRAELITIARKYEEAALRQKPYTRLIEEIRLLDFADALQEELERNMLAGLSEWIAHKPAARGLSSMQTTALLISVFGGWLYYMTMLKQGAPVEPLRDTLINDWATIWASVLDRPRMDERS